MVKLFMCRCLPMLVIVTLSGASAQVPLSTVPTYPDDAAQNFQLTSEETRVTSLRRIINRVSPAANITKQTAAHSTPATVTTNTVTGIHVIQTDNGISQPEPYRGDTLTTPDCSESTLKTTTSAIGTGETEPLSADFPVGLAVGFPAAGIAVIVAIVVGFKLYRNYRKGRLWCQKRDHVKPQIEAGTFSTWTTGDHGGTDNGHVALADSQEMQPSHPGSGFVEIYLNDGSEEHQLSNVSSSHKTHESRSKSDRETVVFDKRTREFSFKRSCMPNEILVHNAASSLTVYAEQASELEEVETDITHIDIAPSDNVRDTVAQKAFHVNTWITRSKSEHGKKKYAESPTKSAEFHNKTPHTQDRMENGSAGLENIVANDEYDYTAMAMDTSDYEPTHYSNCEIISQYADNVNDRSTNGNISSDNVSVPPERRFLSRSMINKRSSPDSYRNNPERAMTVQRPPRQTPSEFKRPATLDAYEYPPGIPIATYAQGKSYTAEIDGRNAGLINDNVPAKDRKRIYEDHDSCDSRRDSSPTAVTPSDCCEEIIYDYPRTVRGGTGDTTDDLNEDGIQESENIYDYPRPTMDSFNNRQSGISVDQSTSVGLARNNLNTINMVHDTEQHSCGNPEPENEMEDNIYQVPRSASVVINDDSNDEECVYVNLNIQSR